MIDLPKFLKDVERRKQITGQLFFREMGPSIELDLTDRSIFAVVGSLAIPKNLIETESQYAIAGFKPNLSEPILGLASNDPIRFKDKYHGFTLANILLEPIWRV
ncbi:MAG: hypothetical protein ACFFG0_00345 [Candidatus Thorarchaeota archaeon]